MLGLIHYNQAATLQQTATNNFLLVSNLIDNDPLNAEIPNPSGNTNIGDAIAAATDKLDDSGVVGIKVEILLTDGLTNQPNPPPPPDQALSPKAYAEKKAQAAKDAGIMLFTIGLGSAVDDAFLADIATHIDGQPLYYPAPDATQLEGIYQQIAEIIIFYNIRQSVWYER